jgi:Long-chain fatty acid transport protein
MSISLVATALLVQPAPTWAGGYALREQSTSALGNAFAGSAASAEDLSFIYFNPAGATRLVDNQLLVTGALILPDVHFKNGAASTARGIGLTGGEGGNSITPTTFLPAFYALLDAEKTFGLQENIKFGLSVNVPFGLESDYADGWVGRYYALHSRVSSITFTPTVAYEIVEGLSIAAGPQFQYLDARLTNAIDFGSIGQASRIPGSQPGQQDGRAEVSGDDWGYGYSLGVLYEPWPGTRLGAAFRSKINHNLRGDANFNLGSAGIGSRISRATGAFVSTDAEASVTTPWNATFGFHQDIDDQWAVMGTLERTGWSSFRDLTIKFQNPSQPDNVTDNSWNDTWFGALGVSYRPAEDWGLRIGGAWDEGPSPGSKRTPRIPLDGRGWLAIGASYRPFQDVVVDFGYAHLFFNDAGIDLNASGTGNAARGNLSGEVETSVDIISLQARLSF